MTDPTMIIAQISDLHLRTDGRLLKGKVDTMAALNAAIEHLNKLSPRPDLVLATGDLVNKAHEQDYRVMRREFDRLEMPVYIIPGNHDDRDMMRHHFTDQGYLGQSDKFLLFALEDYPLRLVGLDTKRDDHDGGEMCAERLGWLDQTLSAEPARPTLIFMHHPPFVSGIGFMDKRPFVGADKLEDIVKRHPQITGIVCGHMHRPISVAWGGTIACVAPSLVFQMTMDLTPGATSSFMLEPAACPIVLWNEDHGMIYHCSQIGPYGDPNPFVVDPL
ncbi:MAG: phosphodiesterase [Rhodospirillaceae bacterium]|nr:phosphodiesterase [Rhodospirillaceae bacterium]